MSGRRAATPPRTVSAEAALRGRRWAVVEDFGGHTEVDELYMTRAIAERAAETRNREGSSPGGTPWEVARIEVAGRHA